MDLLDGREIRGVDRGGKSDPYAVFSLNGQKVFKSQTKKKTVTPDWNEHFEVSVVSPFCILFLRPHSDDDCSLLVLVLISLSKSLTGIRSNKQRPLALVKSSWPTSNHSWPTSAS